MITFHGLCSLPIVTSAKVPKSYMITETGRISFLSPYGTGTTLTLFFLNICLCMPKFRFTSQTKVNKAKCCALDSVVKPESLFLTGAGSIKKNRRLRLRF